MPDGGQPYGRCLLTCMDVVLSTYNQQLHVLGRGEPAEQNQPVTESGEDQVQQA